MAKITEISRSFSQTRQYKQFEPVNIFASYKAELNGNETVEELREISRELYQKAQTDVLVDMEKTVQQLKNIEPPF